jgi:hypothetical protein
MNHKAPAPPLEVIRLLHEALERLERCSEMDGKLPRYLECKRVLSERIAKLEAEIAMTCSL